MRSILLDLAGDAARARAWLEQHADAANVVAVDKAELKSGSKRDELRRLRAGGAVDVFAIFCNRLEHQPARALMLVYGRLAGARRVIIGDMAGRTIERGTVGIALVELPRFALEIALGYGLVVPLAWVLTWLVGLIARRSRRRLVPPRGPLDILYLRATPAAGSAVGGSTSHIAGMACAAADLGHRIRFVANDALPGIDDDRMPVAVIRPSGAFASNRAIFEVWNSLVFSFGAWRRARRSPPDLVYQRYNRFNWTGVLLAALLDRPLCLEFNGSESWVAENWDPVGQRGLLAAVERLNLRAADRICVVSEVLADVVASTGVSRDRIVINPNGADPERFRPNVGGSRVRGSYGIEERIVAGFVGTFGPWHGVDVLAKAIVQMTSSTDIAFLLVGDGDLRPGVERRLAEGGASDRAILAGRVAHDDVAAYLDACDILLSPHVEMPDGSAFFGSPTKLFEYMAMGKAIVASRLGQIGDVVVDGVSGLLVPPGDVAALVAAIHRLATDAALRERLGQGARDAVMTSYTWRRNAERVISAFRENASGATTQSSSSIAGS